MADNLSCNVCGGTDFYNEAGFYYCNECQTQTQEIREQHYDLHDDLLNVRLTKKTIRKDKQSTANKNKITSWEGYNYILAGLVNELLELGASQELKDVTNHIWISYLLELEILSTKPTELPKLGAFYVKKDAEIVYKRYRQRKNKKSKASSVVSNNCLNNSKLASRELANRKRALVNAEYQTYTSTQPSDTSLHNQSLSNLASSDDESVKSEKVIKYNKAARKEFLKHMSYSHMLKHAADANKTMKCHKGNFFLYSTLNSSAYILSRNKLYSILYIGLLLTENDIQLSDILRFCREGHVSFLSYKHFFPETLSDKQIDEKLYQNGHKTIPTHENIRKTAYQMYNILKLKPCNLCPNLKKLCQRYCTELNLPDQVKNMALNLISITQPKLQLSSSKSIPNYEGRAMAFIIYVIKLLFSLDGVTEFTFSEFANHLNNISEPDKNSNDINEMFVWNDWVKYIEYRKVILKNQHFPTNFLLENNSGTNLFLNFLDKKKVSYECNEEQYLSMNITRKLLNDLEILQNVHHESFIDFQHSVTPFSSYLEAILAQTDCFPHGQKLKTEILTKFSKHKLDFLMHPNTYLKKLNNNNFIKKDTGAKWNCQLIRVKTRSEEKEDNVKYKQCEDKWQIEFNKRKIDLLTVDTLQSEMIKKQLIKGSSDYKPNIPVMKHAQITRDMVINKKIEQSKNKVGRNKFGKFQSIKLIETQEQSTQLEFKQKKRGKWFISAWTDNPVLSQNNYNPSLFYEITEGKNLKDVVEAKLMHKHIKLTKNANKILQDKNGKNYYVHFQPHNDYWINVTDVKSLNKYKWKEFETTLPSTFQWLLNECARVIEQTPKDLFAEFVNVELYINYVHLKNEPVRLNNGLDNCPAIAKLITKAVCEW